MIKSLPLDAICRPRQWKTIATKDLTDTGYPVYGANGKIGFYHSYTHEKPTVLITCRGATCGVINVSEPKSYVNGNAMALDELSDDVNLFYLKHFLEYRGLNDVVSGSAQPQITGQGLKKVTVPLPPLPVQKKIAAILDAADELRQKDKALLEKYNELTQALFLDMFGDPVTNPKGWKYDSLAKFGLFKNGLNFSKGETGVSIKYLGVGDFKSLYKIESLSKLPLINLSKVPTKDYLLRDGDLVFVRSNGNKDLVGRCIAIYPNDTLITFSGFCIRYRINSALLTPLYLTQLFRSTSFKKSILQGGRGANIQNINQQMLSTLNIPMPPIEKQQEFTERVDLIEVQKNLAGINAEKSQELFNSLLQRAFKGELV